MSWHEKERIGREITVLKERLAALARQSGPIAEVGVRAISDKITELGRRLRIAS